MERLNKALDELRKGRPLSLSTIPMVEKKRQT